MNQIKLGYFNLCIPVKNDNSLLESNVIFSINKQNYKKYSFPVPIKILDRMQLLSLFSAAEFVPLNSSIHFSDKNRLPFDKSACLDDLVNHLDAYINACRVGLKYAIKDHVIKSIISYYPFIRICPENNCWFITFFTDITYFDGSRELWITEKIPDVLQAASISDIEEYMMQAFTSVRNSYFVDGVTFDYCKGVRLGSRIATDYTPNRLIFGYNYKLIALVQRYFGINLERFKNICRLNIISNNVYSPSILKNTRKKIKKTLLASQKIYLIGVESKWKGYYFYTNTALENLFLYSTISPCLEKLSKLLKQKRILSHYELIDQNILNNYLTHINNCEKINYDVHIYATIQEGKHAKFLNLLSDIALILGKYFNS